MSTKAGLLGEKHASVSDTDCPGIQPGKMLWGAGINDNEHARCALLLSELINYTGLTVSLSNEAT
jgi:hypothetical protein